MGPGPEGPPTDDTGIADTSNITITLLHRNVLDVTLMDMPPSSQDEVGYQSEIIKI
jgi:hypothetical protein